jgi:hypothetical protein
MYGFSGDMLIRWGWMNKIIARQFSVEAVSRPLQRTRSEERVYLLANIRIASQYWSPATQITSSCAAPLTHRQNFGSFAAS